MSAVFVLKLKPATRDEHGGIFLHQEPDGEIVFRWHLSTVDLARILGERTPAFLEAVNRRVAEGTEMARCWVVKHHPVATIYVWNNDDDRVMATLPLEDGAEAITWEGEQPTLQHDYCERPKPRCVVIGCGQLAGYTPVIQTRSTVLQQEPNEIMMGRPLCGTCKDTLTIDQVVDDQVWMKILSSFITEGRPLPMRDLTQLRWVSMTVPQVVARG